MDRRRGRMGRPRRDEVAGRLPTSTGHHGMAMDHAGMSEGPTGSSTWLAAASMQAAMWAAMIAIMVPLIAPNVRFVALRAALVRPAQPGHPRCRRRVVGGMGGRGRWCSGSGRGSQSGSWATRPAIAVFVFVAVLWQMTPTKRRGRGALPSHVRTAPRRRPAVGVCGHFGLRLGLDCVVSCWALMAAMAAAGHALVAVVPLFWVSWYERRRRPHHDPRTRLATGVMACTGVAVVALVALTPWLA